MGGSSLGQLVSNDLLDEDIQLGLDGSRSLDDGSGFTTGRSPPRPGGWRPIIAEGPDGDVDTDAGLDGSPDSRCLEAVDGVRRAEPYEASTGAIAGDAGRVPLAEHFAGLAVVGDPETYPEVGVCPDRITDDPTRRLRREQEMDAQAPTLRRHRIQPLPHIGLSLHEQSELIDHDD